MADASNKGDTVGTAFECMTCGHPTEHRTVFEKWGFPVLRCLGCGLGSVRPAELDAAELYDEGYFQGAKRDGYADYAGSERVLRSGFRREVARLRRYGVDNGRLLEIGCAYGFFLLEAQPYFDCIGIDPSAHAVEFCRSRDLNVLCGKADRRALEGLGPVDAVVMLDVIEHLEDPLDTLLGLSDLLVPGGCVVVSTGDWASALGRFMGRRWRLMTPPQHLFYFSETTLTALLGRVGLRVVHRTRPWRTVPMGLAAFQLSRRMGLRIPLLQSMHSIGLPVNLFDTILLIARKDD